jgi:hypothetical protein
MSINKAAVKTLFFLATCFAINHTNVFANGMHINPQIAEAGYWYADSDIRGVLKNRLGGSVHIAPALPFESKELVKDIVTHSINEAKLGKPALIPVNLNNNHWVALIIRADEAGNLKVLFNDSLGGPLLTKSNAALLVVIFQSRVQQIIKEQFSEIVTIKNNRL